MAKKANKIVWTKALHKKFVQAVETLGVDKAVPKKIVKLMEVDGLTRDHVASHLQKYRLVIKSTSDKDSCNQVASKPSSLMNNGVSWNNSSLMLNQEKQDLASYNIMDANHPPILDTSSSYFSILEDSKFNATTSSELAPSSSLPYEGYSMTNNLDQQRKLMNDSTDLGAVNCLNFSNYGLMQNLDDFIYDYGGSSTEVQKYNNYEIGSSSGGQNSSNSSVLHNPNGFKCNCSCQSGFVEMNPLHGANLNCNLENWMGEDDLMLNEADIASLLSYVDDLPNQDANRDNFQNIVTLDSNRIELTSINKHQDEYYPGFDPNFNMYNISEHMEPMWSPDPIADEMTLEGLNFNSYVQDWCKNQD